MRSPFSFLGLAAPPAPPDAPLAIVPSLGSTAGSTHVVIQVADSSVLTSAAINGMNITGFAQDDGTHVSGNTVAAGAGGPYDVTVSGPGGTSAPLAAAYAFEDPFDITTLPWSSLFVPVYSTLPHLGTASAGASGGRKLISTSVDPVVGEALNGITGVKYNRQPQVARFQTTGGGDVVMDDILTNSDYTISFFARLRSAGLHNATLYKNSAFLAGDAHYNFGVSCDAAFAGNQALVFDAGTQTITRGSGDFAAEGFANGQSLNARGTALNDGDFGGNTISGVTATMITMTGGIVSETTSASDYNVCLSSGGKVDVLHYTGSFVTLPTPPPISMDLHWIFIRHSGGHTQVDIDGVPGTSQVHADHVGGATQQATRNYVTAGYVDRYMAWTEWMFGTAPTAFSDGDRDNIKQFLNLTYGTAY